jgi:hypothetical protein
MSIKRKETDECEQGKKDGKQKKEKEFFFAETLLIFYRWDETTVVCV